MVEKYIRKNKNSYRLDRRTQKGRRSGSFKTLEDAIAGRQYLIDHDWEYPVEREIYKYEDMYYVFNYMGRFLLEYKSSSIHEAKEFLEKNIDTSYIQHKGNKYRIQKSIHDNNIWFGSYSSLDEAITFRDKLIQHNWNIEYFKELYKTSTTYRNRYIVKDKGQYSVLRTYEHHTRKYGRYDTIEEARRRRDYLERIGWKEDTERYLWYYNGNWYVVKNKPYAGRPLRAFYYRTCEKEEAIEFRNTCLERGFPAPLFVTDSLRYIEHPYPYLYTIRRDQEYFGSTHTLRGAMVLRDLLELHDWVLPCGVYVHGGLEYCVELSLYGTFRIRKM